MTNPSKLVDDNHPLIVEDVCIMGGGQTMDAVTFHYPKNHLDSNRYAKPLASSLYKIHGSLS